MFEVECNKCIVEGAILDPQCIIELDEIRRSMMEDYQINPILVRDCSHEIHNECGQKLHSETIHCLMDLARPVGSQERKITSTCMRAVCIYQSISISLDSIIAL